MNCSYSEEVLALFVEDDLPLEQADRIRHHVEECASCRIACERLHNSQVFLKSRLRAAHAESINRQTLAEVRHSVLSRIQESPSSLPFAVRLERALWLGYHKSGFAWAGLALILLVSAVVLTQARRSTQAAGPVAVFDPGNVLIRPDGYREWVFVGTTLGPHVTTAQSNAATLPESFGNVYINRSAYKEYTQTGRFPEGAILVLELAKGGSGAVNGSTITYENNFSAVEVSVKDSARFAGGWGFFDFAGDNGVIPSKAAESSGCRACHKNCAESDHVFTQFYPLLRSTRA